MLDEQQVANQTALTEADIRRIVRSELERAGQQETAATKAAFIAPLCLVNLSKAAGETVTFRDISEVLTEADERRSSVPAENP